VDEKSLEVRKEEMETPEGIERTRPGRTYVPQADIFESNGEVVLLVDMPGVDAESLDIVLEENVLKLSGSVDFEAPEGYDLALAEYGVGNFQRAFSISNEIDQSRIEASIKNGVLRLVLPKAVPTMRKIAVKSV
jgi:HSP20 family protein